MKIFCIGLSKTGTASLIEALSILGYTAKHWDYTKDIYSIPSPGEGLCYDYSKIDPIEALGDTPVAAGFKQLNERYPDSRFILTVREMDAWLVSCKKHFGVLSEEDYVQRLSHPLEHDSLHQMIYDTIHFDEARMREAYNRHESEVRQYFGDRVLVLNVCAGDGWAVLCPFLGKQKPGTPFPLMNLTPAETLFGRLLQRLRLFFR